MKNIPSRCLCFLLSAIFLSALTGCFSFGAKGTEAVIHFTSFRDVPGLTPEDIKDVEELLAGRDSFSYAMLLGTSAFINTDGEIRGYSALVCEWLTELFDVPFVLEHITWNELLDGLKVGTIDFTGTMTPTEERRRTYFMTDPIAQRSIRYIRLAGSEPIERIMETRLPRYALLEGAVSSGNVIKYAIYDFEPVFIREYGDARELLITGEIDALLAENTVEAIFDKYNDVVSTPFLPTLFTPVSLTTQNPELEPIIKVVQKVIENGGKHFLDELFDAGYHEYLSHKLFLQLTPEEINYMKNNPVIPLGGEYANYPISFYSDRYNEWQGIAFDVLAEVERLTGLRFEVHNEPNTQFYDLLEMLQDGRVYMVSEVIQTPEREGIYIWPENALMTDRSVLISKVTYPTISTNRLYSAKVGLSKGSAYTEFFFTWFPNHENYIIYHSQQATFDALKDGEVDMVMNSYSTLLNLINYQELPDYKANILFDNFYPATFGINKEQVVLCSIIDKALALIDTEIISEHWKNRTYDYNLRLMQAQRPWIIGVAVLLLCVLILVFVFLKRSHSTGKKLERLVEVRTHELELVNKYKSSFLANMSHEIRTPMNAILGITEILIQNENLPEEIEIGLSNTYNSCDLLLGIINDILDFSKIEAGKLDIISAPYSLASLINDSVQLNLMKLESKPIEFEVNVCENVPANLIGDEIRIKQILNNLLSNAFKYTDSGKIALSVDYSPILEEDNEIILLLKVEDSGRGMSEEQINKLFVEYMRFNGEENNKIEGTGLGLTITQRLISLMGGKIHVESEKDKGSLFTINLPQRTKDNEILGKEVAENLRLFRTKNVLQNIRCQVTREAMPYGSVLVVDDVETNLYVAIGLMKPYELQIDTASSGKEAIEKIKEGKVYDIIFMDHMMPEMDGMEATKIIREFGYKAAIVALTANAVVGQVDIFLKNGFDEFISKPVDVRRLNTILNRFIRDKQSPEVIEAVRLRKSNEDSKNTSVQIDSMMLESFIKDARKAVAVLEELYQKNELESNADDLRRFTTFVHGIKSSLWNIGEKELSKAASELEAEARKNNINLLILKTPKFLNELRSLSEKLEAEYAASLSLADKPIFSDKKINGLDIEKGLKKYNNDEKSYLGIIRSYAATMRSMFDILENVSEKNLHDYGIKVHGIKGSSRDIFADETGEIAAGLEIAAKAEDFDYIKEHNPVLLENVRRLVGDLEALITAIDLQNPKPKKIKPSPEVLTKLLAACKMYDMDSGDEAMDELEEFSYEEDSELVEWLRDKFDMTRFDEIAERLSNEINK